MKTPSRIDLFNGGIWWEQGVRVESNRHSGGDPPSGDWVYEPVDPDLFPDYDTKPVLFYANA